jgi:hypothetical protein
MTIYRAPIFYIRCIKDTRASFSHFADFWPIRERVYKCYFMAPSTCASTSLVLVIHYYSVFLPMARLRRTRPRVISLGSKHPPSFRTERSTHRHSARSEAPIRSFRAKRITPRSFRAQRSTPRSFRAQRSTHRHSARSEAPIRSFRAKRSTPRSFRAQRSGVAESTGAEPQRHQSPQRR